MMNDHQTDKHTGSFLKWIVAPFTRLWDDTKQPFKVWQTAGWTIAGLAIRGLLLLSVLSYIALMLSGIAVIVLGYGTAGIHDMRISNGLVIILSICAGFANLPVVLTTAYRERNQGQLPQGRSQMRMLLKGMLIAYAVTLTGVGAGLGIGLLLVPGSDVRLAVPISAIAGTIGGPIGLISIFGQSVFSPRSVASRTGTMPWRESLKLSSLYRIVRLLFSAREMWYSVTVAVVGYSVCVLLPSLAASNGWWMFADVENKLVLNQWVNVALLVLTVGTPLPQDIVTSMINTKFSRGYLVQNTEEAKAIGKGALNIQLASMLGAIAGGIVGFLVNVVLSFFYPLAGSRAKTLLVQLVNFYVSLFFGTWTARIMARMLPPRSPQSQE